MFDRSKRFEWIARVLWVVSLVAVPALEATAAPPKKAPSSEAEPEVDPASEVDSSMARKLDAEAQAHYDAGEFVEAIEKWKAAYFKLPTEPAWDIQRNELRLRLAYAYREAFEQSRDIEHLRRSIDLFSVYLTSLSPEEAEMRNDVADERDRAVERLEQARSEQQSEFEQRQRNKIAYLEQRVHRFWVPEETGTFWAVGYQGLPMTDVQALVHMGYDDLSRQVRGRRIARITLFSIGGAVALMGIVTSVVVATLDDPELVPVFTVSIVSFSLAPIGPFANIFIPRHLDPQVMRKRVKEYNRASGAALSD